MPRAKGWRRSEARKSALRKAARGKTKEDGDSPDCLPDGGRDDPVDLTDDTAISKLKLALMPKWEFAIQCDILNDMCFQTAKETGSGAKIETCSNAKVRTGSGANIKSGIDASIETGSVANIETDFCVTIETGFDVNIETSSGASTENCDTMIDILNDTG